MLSILIGGGYYFSSGKDLQGTFKVTRPSTTTSPISFLGKDPVFSAKAIGTPMPHAIDYDESSKWGTYVDDPDDDMDNYDTSWYNVGEFQITTKEEVTVNSLDFAFMWSDGHTTSANGSIDDARLQILDSSNKLVALISSKHYATGDVNSMLYFENFTLNGTYNVMLDVYPYAISGSHVNKPFYLYLDDINLTTASGAVYSYNPNNTSNATNAYFNMTSATANGVLIGGLMYVE